MGMGRNTHAIVHDGIQYRRPFANSTESLRGVEHEPGGYVGMGVLRHAEDWVASLLASTFVVYSYATPIAWYEPARGWVMPEYRYSATTGTHQSAVRTGLRYAGHEPMTAMIIQAVEQDGKQRSLVLESSWS